MFNQGIGDRAYYEQYYSLRDWRAYNPILAKIVLFSEPGIILDVGAGIGLLGEAALNWHFDYEGLEGSIEAIEIAHNRCPKLLLKHHLLSDSFPYDNNVFQTVVLNQVIEHLEPEIAVSIISEIFRVLKPGGMVFITSPSKFNSHEKNADRTHISLYSPQELRQLLESRNFEKIQAMNSALNLLGDNYLGKVLMYILFKATKFDWLSATANCIAYKPI